MHVYQDLRYEYDVHGNVTSRKKGAHEEAKFTWNAEHQLKEAKVTRKGTEQTTRYEYDALGRRTRKIDAFGATEYLWDGDLMIESRRNNKYALYLFEPRSFVPLATVQDEKTYWYQCDQVGAPQELTDEAGTIAWAADYKVWGEATLRKTGTDGTVRYARRSEPPPPVLDQPFRFLGQQFDEETGLHYNRFRYYDPGVGRFVSQDPVGLKGGINLFEYAPSPTAWTDPFGLTGAKGTLSGPNIPGGTQTGLSTGEGGGGITNPAVQEAYDNVPLDQRSKFHGRCSEAESLSKSANEAGVKTLDELKKVTEGAESEVWRNDKKKKPMAACPSCAHVQKQLGITDKCQ
jgi:RHS repeat-associated protein